ncbi:DUF3558 domain-containing protein [Nocardia thailandica]
MGAQMVRGGGIAVLACSVLMVSACSAFSDEGSVTATSSPSLAAELPSGFDPCTQIPKSVLESENLVSTGESKLGSPGGVFWRGCGWAYKNGDGYATSIRTTNLTVQMVQARKFPDAEELALAGGRRAIVSRQGNSDPATPKLDTTCTANIELTGGSLDIFVSNSKQAPATGTIPACTIARSLAEKIAPSIPAGA